MKAKELLPIGSVVLLKGAKKKLMIIGSKALAEDTGQKRDYVAVLYPEGYLSRDVFFTFNHEEIDEVFFEGYDTPERQRFISKVEEVVG